MYLQFKSYIGLSNLNFRSVNLQFYPLLDKAAYRLHYPFSHLLATNKEIAISLLKFLLVQMMVI